MQVGLMVTETLPTIVGIMVKVVVQKITRNAEVDSMPAILFLSVRKNQTLVCAKATENLMPWSVRKTEPAWQQASLEKPIFKSRTIPK